jgi:hypothetical protein
MSYTPPGVNEMIYAVQTGVSVYEKPSRDATRLLTNNQYDDHSLREFRAGDPVGRIVSQQLWPNPTYTENFLKVQYWTWENQGSSILGLFGKNVQIFHEGFVSVEDDPAWWIRETHRAVASTTTQADAMRQEILTVIRSTVGVPEPVSIEKQAVGGTDDWLITFPNGYPVLYSNWKKLSEDNKRSNTTALVPKNSIGADGTGKGLGDGSTFFTTKNILIMAGIVVLAGVALMLYIFKKKPKK